MLSGKKQTIKKNTSYYLTLTVVDWIDVFTRKNHKQAIVDSLHYCIENKGLNGIRLPKVYTGNKKARFYRA